MSSPSGTDKDTTLKARLLAAFSAASGEIAYTRTTNTSGGRGVIQENWYYPWQAATGQQVRNRQSILSLDGKEATGWNTLAEYAKEPTAEPDEEHKGVVCAPADPAFDENAAETLAKQTQTDPGDWGYPVKDGVEVHAAAKPDALVTDKLGSYGAARRSLGLTIEHRQHKGLNNRAENSHQPTRRRSPTLAVCSTVRLCYNTSAAALSAPEFAPIIAIFETTA